MAGFLQHNPDEMETMEMEDSVYFDEYYDDVDDRNYEDALWQIKERTKYRSIRDNTYHWINDMITRHR